LRNRASPKRIGNVGSLGPLVIVLVVLGVGLVSAVWWFRRRQQQTNDLIRRERHDWNNHVMSLIFNMSSLRHRLAMLVSSDTHRTLNELVDDIDAHSKLLMRRSDRLDKVLGLHVSELRCSSACPGCREVDHRATNLVVNLAVNAREATARRGSGRVVAECDHQVLIITNPRPEAADLKTRSREHFGLRQVTADAHALDWDVEVGPVKDTHPPLWRATVRMNDPRASTAPAPPSAAIASDPADVHG
jgi:hypothetical protein